ncbi:hypothetical protein LTR42_005419 [Elasticomyces elasticus]|nr:hypothetical protein LTR42_005419 [Elasticomyces elasticus]
MVPRTQKAVFVYEVGKPVRLGERDVPSPKGGQVLVKVAAAHLLPHDAYGRDWGLFIGEKLPFVLAGSVAGIIKELGLGVTFFRVGDRVFGTSNIDYPTPDQAGLQEYAVLQTDSMALTPKEFSDEQMATLGINVPTAAVALFTGFGFNLPPPWSGDFESFDFSSLTIVVLGAGTNIAKLFIRLATRLLDVGRIIAVASLSNADELKEAGAAHVIDRHSSEESVIAQVHSAAGGAENVTHLIDCVTWEHRLATKIMARNAASRLVTLQPVDEDKVREQRPLCKPVLVENLNINLGEPENFWRELPKWLSSGVVRPTAFKTLEGLDNVDEINRQLDEYAAGKGTPQLIVRP